MKKIICCLLILLSGKFSFSQSGWVPQQSGTTYSLRSVFFVNANTGWACGDEGVIIKTTNGGMNWFHQTTNTTQAIYGILFSDASNGIAGGYYNDGNPWCQETGFLLTTSNGGNTWNIQHQGYNGRKSDFTSLDNNFYIAYEGVDMQCISSTGAISKTTNNGNNWTSYIPLANTHYAYYSVHFINSLTGWAIGNYTDDCCHNDVLIVRTTTAGTDWTIQKEDTVGGFQVFRDSKVRFVNATTGFLFAKFSFSENFSLLKTTDAGVNWFYTDSLLTRGKNNLHFANSQTGWCIGDYGSLIFTSDGGTNWQVQSSNTGAYLYGIHFLDEYTGWVCGSAGAIIKTVTGGLTGISPSSEIIPEQFLLEQNFPNPFNPVTKIKYTISSNAFVSLKVFNASGREVKILENKFRQAGTYEVEFDAIDFPSGIYFYKLETDNGSSITKRMVLIK